MTEQTDSNDEVKEVQRLRLECPHCGSFMKVRTSKTHLSTYRELYLNCSNEFECGYRTTGDLIFKKVLTPSYRPNPDVKQELSAWFKRQARLEHEGQMRLGIEDPSKRKGKPK
ncbi:ogr/Delta-like zinc finger family protein [Vreelandella piezotolerans]|uniref:ogr/Delta-like zinc finger family protein n=1 Tax=Vreelandella piezotolerans TaxID=2609667 RepID=UPI0037AC4D04